MYRLGSSKLLPLLALLIVISPAGAQPSPDPLDEEKDFARALFTATTRTHQERARERSETLNTIERVSLMRVGQQIHMHGFSKTLLPYFEAELADLSTETDQTRDLWRMWELTRQAQQVTESMHHAGGAQGIRLTDVMWIRAAHLGYQLRLARLYKEKGMAVANITAVPFPDSDIDRYVLDELTAIARAREETLRRTPAEIARDRFEAASIVVRLETLRLGEQIVLSDERVLDGMRQEATAAADLMGSKEMTPALLKRLWVQARESERITTIQHLAGGAKGIRLGDVFRTRLNRVLIEMQLIGAYRRWPGAGADSVPVLLAWDRGGSDEEPLDRARQLAEGWAEGQLGGLARLQKLIELPENLRRTRSALDDERFIFSGPDLLHRALKAQIAVTQNRAELLSLWTSRYRLALKEESVLGGMHRDGGVQGVRLSDVLAARLRRLQIESRLAEARERQ